MSLVELKKMNLNNSYIIETYPFSVIISFKLSLICPCKIGNAHREIVIHIIKGVLFSCYSLPTFYSNIKVFRAGQRFKGTHIY